MPAALLSTALSPSKGTAVVTSRHPEEPTARPTVGQTSSAHAHRAAGTGGAAGAWRGLVTDLTAHGRMVALRAGAAAGALALLAAGGAYATVQVVSPEDSAGTLGAAPAVMALRVQDSQQEQPAQPGAVEVDGGAVTISAVSEDVEDAYTTTEEETDSLPEGTRKVKTAGVNGLTRTTFQVTSVDGAETSRDELSSVVVRQRVDEVVLVGTGKKVAQAAGGGRSGSAGGAVVNDDGSLDDDFARLAQCESGGNPRAVNPAGYYGLYQFSLSTWRAVGGTGNPIDASPEEQLMRAKMLQARAGWGQWGCPH